MSTQTQTSEPLFSKKNRALLSDPLNDNNPITIQVLGVCSALAVTGSVKNALVMAVAVTIITAFSNLTVSLLRNVIPSRIRMIVQLVVIATLVTIVSYLLQAFLYDLSKELSVYVGLIITNCILMGRLEAFAMGNKPWPSFLDGIGNGLGYGVILLVVGLIREVFGSGAIFGFPLPFVSEMAPFRNGIMVLPIASIFIIGVLIWIQRGWNTKLVDAS